MLFQMVLFKLGLKTYLTFENKEATEFNRNL